MQWMPLAAQDEAYDDVTGDVSQSPGFHVIYLPFANDIRNPQVDPTGPDARMSDMRRLSFECHSLAP